MKHVLITGANSYIGTTFDRYMAKWSEKYKTDTIDMRGEAWRKADFSKYAAVFHVAGIAHADTGNIDGTKKSLYYKVNTDLAVKTAIKAKSEGVRQFIYMSSEIVYGDSAAIGEQKRITESSLPIPASCYGDSKLQAEKGLLLLATDDFKIVILRPPMIYGSNCKGNYPILVKFAKWIPIFPLIDNSRSMLYVENLCEFVRLMIKNEESGIFFPPNAEYSCTSEMVRQIAKFYGRHICFTKLFNPLLRLMSKHLGLINKAFGSFTYAQNMSEYKENYCIYSLDESIHNTEKSKTLTKESYANRKEKSERKMKYTYENVP